MHKPLGATYVEVTELKLQYEEGDVVGLVLAVTTVSILGVFLILCTWFAARREIYTLFFLVGAVCSEIVNVILKLLIAEQRPNRTLSPHLL